jgi:hypothetical protein
VFCAGEGSRTESRDWKTRGRSKRERPNLLSLSLLCLVFPDLRTPPSEQQKVVHPNEHSCSAPGKGAGPSPVIGRQGDAPDDVDKLGLPRSDGALVGGSSLKPEFVDIIRCVPLSSNHGTRGKTRHKRERERRFGLSRLELGRTLVLVRLLGRAVRHNTAK